jgi:DNA-3-methyladenine glycosylase
MRVPDIFYTQDVLVVAPALLGKFLCHWPTGAAQPMRRRITETEAYRGQDDTACHASCGMTNRNAVMFGPGGFAYVYLCYGIHNMLNIVTGPAGSPQAVLIRGLEGLAGPGILTRALGINRAHNGHDMRESALLWLEDDGLRCAVCAKPRVGIGYASPEDQARLWRFAAGAFAY